MSTSQTSTFGWTGMDVEVKKVTVFMGTAVVLFASALGFFGWCLDWEESSNYHVGCVNGFIAGWVFVSIALGIFSYGISQIPYLRMVEKNKEMSLIAIASCAVIVGVTMLIQWKGYVYLIWDSSVSPSPVKTLLSLMIFLLMAFVCADALIVLCRSRLHVSESRRASEDTPLLAGGLELTETSKGGGLDYIPSTYREDFSCMTSDGLFLTYVAVVMPTLFFLCTLLPASYEEFSIKGIRHWTSREHHSSLKNVWRSAISHSRSLVFIPDVCLFYGFVLACLVSAYIARKSLWFRIEMRRSRMLGPIVITQGEWVSWCAFVPILVLMCIYWFAVRDDTLSGYDYNGLYRIANGFGRMSAVFLGLSLFPSARNSIWLISFGVSYEAANRTHKAFGHLFLLALVLHVLFWLIFFGANQELWDNVIFASIPYEVDSADFTIPVAYYVTLFVVVPVFAVFTLPFFRRKYFEWFYHSHTLGTILMLLTMIWHGSYLWYFLFPPVAVLIFDQLTRIYSQHQSVAVRNVQVYETSGVLRLTLRLNHEKMDFGQYFRLNVPSISRMTWHPMAIHAFDRNKKTCTFLIERKEAGQWTDRLYELCAAPEAFEMKICLDGPYGPPLTFDAYRKILLIVDGIGYAPIMGFFEHMLRKAVGDETQLSVDLVWISESPRAFLLFEEQLKLYAEYFDNDPDRLFDVKLCYTQNHDLREVRQISSALGNLSLEHGNPDLVGELNYIEQLGSFTLIMGYGTNSLLHQCKKVALRYGAHYRCEPFYL